MATPDHQNRMGKKVRRTAVGTIAVMLAASCLVLPGCSKNDTPGSTTSLSAQGQTLCKGITIGGVDVSGMNQEQAIQAVRAAQEQLPAYRLTLKLKDKSWDLTEQDMAFLDNAEDAVHEAMDYLYGDNGQHYKQRASDLAANPKDYEVKYEVDYTKLNEKLDTLVTEEMNVDPVDATVASFDSGSGTFQFKDGQNGIKVDSEKLHTAVKGALLENPTATVEVPFEEVEFSKTTAQIKNNMRKLGTYSTTSTNNANGNHNMRLALSSVNGTVLQPGEIFSFNGKTGNTTNGSLGYKKAGAIVGGKLVDEYGGGICQASTTIYGAALRSDMKILTRYNHTWPSTYCPIGQDAAVSYGSLDFRFQNTSEYPIYIVAGMSGTTLTVTFYGYQDPSYDEIKITSQQTGTVAQPADVYQEDKSLAKDKIVKQRSGRVGKRAAAQRIYYKNGSVVKRENLPSSYYRELAALYHYGPGSAIPGSTSSASSDSSEVASGSEVTSSSQVVSSETPSVSSNSSAPVNSSSAPPVVSSQPSASSSTPEPPASSSTPEAPSSSTPAPTPSSTPDPAPNEGESTPPSEDITIPL